MICTHCGYLADDEPSRSAVALAGDPHRRIDPVSVQASLRGASRCPACDARAWADPTLEATALAMRGVEDRPVTSDGATGIDRGSVVLGAASVLSLVAYGVWLGLGALPILGKLGVLLAGAGLAAGTLAIAKRLLHARPRRVTRPPASRWHLALPTATAMRGQAAGPVSARDGLLHAPLTLRPCVAYELGVRADEAITDEAGTWLLLEQRSVALRVGDRTFPADCVRLQWPRERMALTSVPAQRLQQVLSSRAFTGRERGLVVVESVVAPGREVEIASAEVELAGERFAMPCLRPREPAPAQAASRRAST